MVKKSVQSQSANQFQAEPGTSKVTAVFYTDLGNIDLHPFRFAFFKKITLVKISIAFGGPFDSQSTFLVDLPQIGDDPLSRTPLCAIGFDQRPISVTFALLSAVARSDKHVSIVMNKRSKTTGMVFTTRPFRLRKENEDPDKKTYDDLEVLSASKALKMIKSFFLLRNLG